MFLNSAPVAAAFGSIRWAYLTALGLLGLDRALIRRVHAKSHTLVLNLHRVSPVESPFWPPLRPETFDELIGFLKGLFEVVTLAELALIDPRKAAVVLSFDDGYRDFIEHAAPILAAHGVRANQNVIPDCIESGRPIWNVRLYDGLAAAPPNLFRELRVEGFSHPRPSDDSPHGMARFGARLARHLKNRPAAERLPLWRQVESWLSRVEIQHPTQMMTAEEVRSIARTHEVGVHSYSHESMAFEDDAFFHEDVRRCRAFFTDRLNLPLKVYAFPNGSYRPSHLEHLFASDFEHALIVEDRPAATRGKVLPRLSIHGSTPIELRLRALGHRV